VDRNEARHFIEKADPAFDLTGHVPEADEILRSPARWWPDARLHEAGGLLPYQVLQVSVYSRSCRRMARRSWARLSAIASTSSLMAW